MIIVDTREQKWEHIKNYLERNNIPYKVEKLDVGDYKNTEHPQIVIDRKANLQEVCTNLQNGKENFHRFMKECRRAREQGFEFVVLVEGTNCKEIADAKKWKSKFSKHTGDWLVKQMRNLEYSYQVNWMFCKKNETPRKILELLKYDK